jgi:DNA repair exonuclease SbcCD nuclease subunit
MNFCFVHAADLHLDTPFQGLGRVDDALAGRLRDASLDAFDRLVALTRERGAAFLVLSGDVYDGAERGLRAQLRFREGLARLSADGIPTFVIHGNHDPLDGWSAIRAGGWPEHVTVFGSGEVGAVPVERDGVRIATVYGISYPTREVRENLALRFRREDAPGLHVALLHGTVDDAGGGDHGTYSPCTLEDLRAAGMDYWALGHIHRRAVLHEGGPWVVYPGNLQGRSLKPSEQGAKGATVVEVEDGRIVRAGFVACDRVRFRAVEVPVDALADAAALADAMVGRLERLADEEDGCELLVRVRLTGRGEVSRELRRGGGVDGLLRGVRDALEARTRGVWCDGIVDESRPPLELERIRGRGDFSSEILRWADRLTADAEEQKQFVELPWDALRRAGLVPADPGEVDSVLREAVELALGMLEEEAAQ